MNGVEAGLGSVGVGTGVGVMPNGKALLGGSAPPVVGVGGLNLNLPVLVAEPGAGAGTSTFEVVVKVKPAVLEASVDPIAGNPNSFVAVGLDLSLSFSGTTGNDGMVIAILAGGVAAEAGADSFKGDPLSISSSRVGGVLVFSRGMFAGVGCGLGAAVGAVNTILGAGAVWVLNSGAGLA